MGAGRCEGDAGDRADAAKVRVNPAFSRLSGPDSNSCDGCHNDPVVGGSGDFVADVFVSEGFESAQFDSTDPSFPASVTRRRCWAPASSNCWPGK